MSVSAGAVRRYLRWKGNGTRGVRTVLIMALLCGRSVAQPTTRPGNRGAARDDPASTRRETFDRRSPHSAIGAIAARLGWEQGVRTSKLEREYDLAAESFEVGVPDGYEDGAAPYGLLIWVSPSPDGRVPELYFDVLARHRLIWCGANRSGNDRAPWVRVGLALDAVHNMPDRYRVDPDRVYVGGLSGGGRVSSMTAIAWPDVFDGGYYLIGSNFYRDVPADKGRFHRRGFMPPPVKYLRLAKDRSRHVLLTGDTDANRPQTQRNHDQMRKDRFRHVTYLQVPGMGHEPPPAEWFEKGIEALDARKDGPTTHPADR